jgi:hypothetical protein
MNLSLKTIQVAFNLLIEHLESKGVDSISLEKDFYWIIPQDQRYNPYIMPDVTLLMLGQLFEDVENLQRMQVDNNHIINYGFVWLAHILIYIGETTPE